MSIQKATLKPPVYVDGAATYPDDLYPKTSADQVIYDNTESGLTATTGQGAIDEIKAELGQKQAAISASGLLKGDGSGGISAATHGASGDYLSPSDVVNDLTTGGAGVPLSAAQGVALETQIGQLANINAINLCAAPFDIFTNGNLDGAKISPILAANNKSTFVIPDGLYLLVNPINIVNEACLTFGTNTVIKPAVAMADMVVYNYRALQTIKRRLEGGVWDGDGKATTIFRFTQVSGLIFGRMLLKNSIGSAIAIDNGYELNVHDLHFINTLETNITGNIAIECNTSDCTFDTITIAYYTTGLKITKGANQFDHIHIYCGAQVDRASYSVGIEDSGGNHYHDIYFDTCFRSLIEHGSSTFSQCTFCFGASNRAAMLSNPVYITNQNVTSDNIIFDACKFLYQNAPGQTDEVTLIDSFTYSKFMPNCIYNSSTSIINRPDGVLSPGSSITFVLGIDAVLQVFVDNSVIAQRAAFILWGGSDTNSGLKASVTTLQAGSDIAAVVGGAGQCDRVTITNNNATYSITYNVSVVRGKYTTA